MIYRILTITCLVLGSLYHSNSSAQAIDNTFNYQGELMSNGSLANGLFDFDIQAYTAVIGGSTIGATSSHSSVTVTNGLFNIEAVNLGNYIDGDDVYIEVSVRPAGVGFYTPLSPRQKIKAVPYASSLTRKGAASGEVLTYDGFDWNPATVTDNQNLSLTGTALSISGGTGVNFTGWDTNASDDFSGNYNDLTNQPFIPAASPWTVSGSNIGYSSGVVSIGSQGLTGTALSVSSGSTASSMVAFRGGTDHMYNAYYEDNVYRGYIGSFFGAADDFNIGASSGHMQLTTSGQIRVDVNPAGDTEFTGTVGIGRPASGTQALVLEDASGGVMFMYGGNSPFVRMYENNLPRGDFGSSLGNTEDFSIGTAIGNVTGKMHLATQSAIGLTLDTDGNIGIGTQTPNNLLHVAAPLNKDVFKATVNGFTALRAAKNLGVSVGSSNLPPASGLYVRTEINSEVSGDADVKAHVYGKINGFGVGGIITSGSSDGFTVLRTAVGVYRITLTTAAVFSDYSVVVTVVDAAVPQMATISTSGTANSFDIHVWNLAGGHVDSDFDFVVFKK